MLATITNEDPTTPQNRIQFQRGRSLTELIINKRIAALLEKLHIQELTKSRARRTNDSALVESNNGSV